MDSHIDLTPMDAALVTDMGGTIVSIDEELCGSLSKSRQEICGQNIIDVFGIALKGLPTEIMTAKVGECNYKLYLQRKETIPPNRLDRLVNHFDQVLDGILDGVVIIDTNRTILYANKKACELMGTKLLSKNMFTYYAEEISDVSILDIVLKTQKPYTAINSFKNGMSSLTTGIPIFDKHTKELKFAVSLAKSITELVAKEDDEKIHKQGSPSTVTRFLSKSKRMSYIISKIEVLTDPNLTVLLTGETGTGKDYFAKTMHEHAFRNRPGHPFVRVNCGAIPDSLLESELFGYEKGAFTGASDSGKKGLIELANNGTLFLDEIGELPPAMQTKLLSTIQYRELIRVGGNKKIKVSAKIVCATNADLLSMIKEGKFRLDLYYRISGITITIPPLRERIGDIPYLIEVMLDEMNGKYGKRVYFAVELLNIFLQYTWPGNIRELRNITEKLVLFGEQNRVDVDDLLTVARFLGGESEKDLLALAARSVEERQNNKGLKDWVENYEKIMIQQVLKSSKTLKEAASILDIDISTLVRKKQKYGIGSTKASSPPYDRH